MDLWVEKVDSCSYIVRDEAGNRYVSGVLPEREARVLAEAERAVQLLEDLLVWNDPSNNHRARALPPSLRARAAVIVSAAKVREVHIIGGEGDAGL